jgi:Ras-related protein Rab-1A
MSVSKGLSGQNPVWKIAIVGEVGVGKTSLLLRFVKDTFSDETPTTLGDDALKKTITLAKEKQVTLMIWDTAGQERFRGMTTSFYRGAQGLIVVFDLSDRTSFDKLNDWIPTIKGSVKNTVPILLVGHKSDLPNNVTSKTAQDWADKMKFRYTEASSKTGEGVNQAFEALAIDISSMLWPEWKVGNGTVNLNASSKDPKEPSRRCLV